MTLTPLLSLFLVGLAAVCGCNQPEPPVQPAANPYEPTEAQPKLATIQLWLGPEQLTAEMALTDREIMTGMMFRTNMAENEGMIFVLSTPQQAKFWMKNCPLPLSVAYLDPDGVIQEIHDLQPHNTNSVISTSENIRFALETPQGWFNRHNIRAGTTVRTERGSLKETFNLQR
jgi:uncharacterized protein